MQQFSQFIFIKVYSDGQWINLQVNFKDDSGNLWRYYLKEGWFVSYCLKFSYGLIVKQVVDTQM